MKPQISQDGLGHLHPQITQMTQIIGNQHARALGLLRGFLTPLNLRKLWIAHTLRPGNLRLLSDLQFVQTRSYLISILSRFATSVKRASSAFM